MIKVNGMGNESINMIGAHDFKPNMDLKQASSKNASGVLEQSKDYGSIFGQNNEQKETTKEEFMERFADFGFDDEIANACWDVLNIDPNDDSDNIDDSELERLIGAFSSEE